MAYPDEIVQLFVNIFLKIVADGESMELGQLLAHCIAGYKEPVGLYGLKQAAFGYQPAPHWLMQIPHRLENARLPQEV